MEQISRKRGGKRTVGHLDLEQRIARLNAEVKKLESVLQLKEYFHKIKFYRGIYVVELRRYFTVKLVDQGFSISEIGRVLGKHHSTIIHLLKDNFDDEVAKIVEQYADEWISKSVYPKSYATTEPSHYHTKGMKTVIKYKLLEL